MRTLLPTIDLVVWKDPGFGRISRFCLEREL